MERSPLRHRHHMVARRLGYWWRVLVAHGSWYPTRILTWQWVQIQLNHCDHINAGAWVAPASYLMEHQAAKKQLKLDYLAFSPKSSFLNQHVLLNLNRFGWLPQS